MPRSQSTPLRAELVSLLAMSMALAALGIDLMLPAFASIRADLGLPVGAPEAAGVVTAYFLGLAVGQIVYGPVADRFGRRVTLRVGFAIYAIGALAAAFAPSFAALLMARFAWGLGAAGPRVVTMAVVRDSYDGDQMARAMSFIMALFVLVPVVAPTLGAAAIAVMSWRWMFVLCVGGALVMLLWSRRLPETLAPEHRLPLQAGRVLKAARAVVTHRQTALYTLALTALMGVFTSYLAGSENVISVTFGLADRFPLIFGGLALVMGFGMLANARLVSRVGTRRLAHVVLMIYLSAAGALTVLAMTTDGHPPLPAFLVTMAVMLGAHSVLIPNLNTVAMAPMGAIAGTAASVIGAVSTAGGSLLGATIDRAFDGTIEPLSIGYLACGVAAVALVVAAERGRLFTSADRTASPRARRASRG